MQVYEVKRGHSTALEGEGLKGILEELFGDIAETKGVYRVSRGAIRDMSVWFDGESLYVDTNMERDVDDETAAATIAAYSTFLERATGFTSKQRRERLQKRAKKGEM